MEAEFLFKFGLFAFPHAEPVEFAEEALEDVNDDQLTELESLLNEAEKQYAEAALDKLVKEEVVMRVCAESLCNRSRTNF